jgi:DNA-binding CsgD family transcriptional regulator
VDLRRPGPQRAPILVCGPVQRAWQAALGALPGRTRRALFVVAVGGGAGLPTLPVLLRSVRLSPDDLAPAWRQDLLRGDQDQPELRHPLLRQVLIEATPVRTRQQVYRQLAALAVPELRPWYAALDVVGPDDRLADRLLQAAADARGRAGYETAARLGGRAAELTGDQQVAADRLLAAAVDALLAGNARQCADWCSRALSLHDQPAFRAAATLLRGRALTWLGRPGHAYTELTQAAERIRQTAPLLAAELYWESTLPSGIQGHARQAYQDAHRAAELIGAAPPPFHGRALAAAAFAIEGAVDLARHWLAGAATGREHRDPVADQHALTTVAHAQLWIEEFEPARRTVTPVVDSLREAGALGPLALALAVRGEVGFWTGSWASARADAAEALSWAEELRQPAMICFALLGLARLEALRGDHRVAAAQLERSRLLGEPLGIDCRLVYEPAVLGLAALGAGDPARAAGELERAWQRARAVGLANPNVVPFAPDLAEAWIRCGEPERALPVLEWLEAAARSGLVYPAAGAARCRGLLADDPDQAAGFFQAARELYARRSMPFEAARTLLCEGEVLRRGRRVLAARAVLEQAQQVFAGLGAIPWWQRAELELTAAGGRDRTPSQVTAGTDELTPQELQVSRLVAAGRSNAEAATALFLSRKTVEAHLTRAYRKLGVRSRTELTRSLLAQGVVD